MSGTTDTASFAINLEGDVASKSAQIADSMEGLRTQINGGVNAIKGMSESLRKLKGNSEEVRAAKERLKDSIANEKAALSGSKIALAEQGKEMKNIVKGSKALADEKKKLAEKQKKLTDELRAGGEKKAADRTKALGTAIGTAGGPVAALRDKLAGLKDIMGEGGAGGATSLLTLGAAGLVAGMAALVVGIAAAGYALAKFIFKGADAARSVGLLREAAMGGNAQWGKNFGDQVDALALKVPTAKEKINALGLELSKTRLGGQVWVDTLNAVTQASAALGDDAGAKIKEFITRGQEFGRFRLDPREMLGTGVDFNEVADALAKSLKIGIADARKQLFEGRTKLADGAKAMKDAVEKKFGGINLRQMLSLDNILLKLGEAFDALTKNVNLEPILNGFKELAGLFELNTVTGQALKGMVEVFGREMGVSITGTIPLIKQMIYGLIIGAQKITIEYLKLRIYLRETFGDSKVLQGIDVLGTALTAGKYAAIGLAAAIGVVGAVMATGIAVLAVGVGWVVNTIGNLSKAFTGVRDTIAGLDWSSLGKAIPDGLLEGLRLGTRALLSGVGALAESAKNKFKSVLGIHSPSTVFADFGENTAEGYARGIEAGGGRAQGAVEGMVSTPSAKSSSGARGGGAINVGGLTINVNVGGGAGANAESIAAAVSSPSVIEQIVKAIVDAAQGAATGVPA